MDDFHRKIQEFLVAKGWNYKDLARRMDVPAVTVWRWLHVDKKRGRAQKPSPDHLLRLAQVSGTSLEFWAKDKMTLRFRTRESDVLLPREVCKSLLMASDQMQEALKAFQKAIRAFRRAATPRL